MTNFFDFGLDPDCKMIFIFRIKTGFGLSKEKTIVQFLSFQSCFLLIFLDFFGLGF